MKNNFNFIQFEKSISDSSNSVQAISSITLRIFHIRFSFTFFFSRFYISEKDKHKSRYFSYMMDKYRCNESETVNFKKPLFTSNFSYFHHRTLVGYKEIDVCRGIKAITALIFY